MLCEAWGPNRFLASAQGFHFSSYFSKKILLSLFPKLSLFLLPLKFVQPLVTTWTGGWGRVSSPKGGKVTFVSISPRNISTVGTDGIAPVSRSLRNLESPWQRLSGTCIKFLCPLVMEGSRALSAASQKIEKQVSKKKSVRSVDLLFFILPLINWGRGHLVISSVKLKINTAHIMTTPEAQQA